MSDFENEKQIGEYPLAARGIRKSVLNKEVGTDYILPDYMGDIKRMLKYTANVVPCNKIVSLAEASFVAVVTFRVMYLDSEDTLTEATFSCDVELVEKLFGESNDANVDYKVQNVALRLNGPRKISAKATVTCEFCAAEEKIICERAGYPGAQMLKKDIMIHTVEYLKNSEREYAEEIDKIEESTSDEIEVIKSFAEAFIDGVHKTDSGINVSGYADAFCLLRGEDEIIRLEKRIPIEEHIACDIFDSSTFIPEAYVTGVTVNLNNVNTDDECSVSVVMNMTVECAVEHHYNQSVSIVRDAFFEGCKNECSYEEIEFSSLGECVFDKASMSVNILRKEEPLYDILERDMTVKNLRYDITGQDLTVLFDAELHMIARGNGKEDCYTVKEVFEFSKKYRLSMTDTTKIYLNAVPCDVSVSFDGEKIYIEAQILISILTENKECEKILTNIEYEEECKNDDRTVIVYYPEKEDTLWSVSKKYSVSPSALATRNGMTNASIFECKKLIIVK